MIVVDEIQNIDVLRKLGEQEFPASVRLVLILNPKKFYTGPLLLPSSIHHVTLSTPYRSTVAITSLAHFIAKCNDIDIPEGDLGTDVQGIKPILYDVGKDESKMVKVIELCFKGFGRNFTVLHDIVIPPSIENITEGPWETFSVFNFFGCEAERVVAVTSGDLTMEQITRAKLELVIVLVDPAEDARAGYGYGSGYAKIRNLFQQAAALGLVEIRPLPVEQPRL